MRLECIAEHTLDMELLSPRDAILDVGARNLTFTREMWQRGYSVFAMEPDPTVMPALSEGMHFIRKALVGPRDVGAVAYAMWGNGTANCLPSTGAAYPSDAEVVSVPAIDLATLSRDLGIQQWGAIKLDCEGAEYDVLMSLGGPMAKQISVEFHLHTGAVSETQVAEVIAHLADWYIPIGHKLENRHYAGASYWDTLFRLVE